MVRYDNYDMSDIDCKNIIVASPANPVTLSNIRTYQLYRVVSDPNVVDDTGRSKINEMINKVNLRDPAYESWLPEGFDPYDWNNGFKNRLAPLPDDWSWKNVVADKKIKEDAIYGTGKFAIRYRNYVRKQQGIALPDKFVQDLGQLAGRYSDQSVGSVLRFVTKFNWNAGDFGDGGSCFWGGREEARDILANQGAWAVQLFSPESIEAGAPVGTSRAWVVPNYPFEGVLTMFNGYSRVFGEPSRGIAKILSNLFGMNSYKEINLENHDSSDGTLYINAGRGFVIGQLGDRRIESDYDFHWPEKILGRCCHCDEVLRDADDTNELEGRLYCESCYDEHTLYDSIAHETFDPDYDGEERMYIRDRQGNWEEISVMSSTFEAYSVHCEGCGDDCHINHMTEVETSGNWYCDECLSEHTDHCSCCGTLHENDDINPRGEGDDEQYLCPVCCEDYDEEHAHDDDEDEDASNGMSVQALDTPHAQSSNWIPF